MQAMVADEMAGGRDFAGALNLYVELVRIWADVEDESSNEPYPRSLAMAMMEFLVNLDDCPWERRVPVDIIGGFGILYLLSDRRDIVEKLGWRFLVEAPLSDEFPNARFGLARALDQVSEDEELLAIARPILVEEEEQARRQGEERAAREAVWQAARNAEMAEGRRILSRMR